jgi:hypothetical protein
MMQGSLRNASKGGKSSSIDRKLALQQDVCILHTIFVSSFSVPCIVHNLKLS